jgi:SAM-dependent methyltransferase
MLHHVEDQAAALAEARRVVRPAGRLALMVFTREDVEENWLSDYFPSTREWMAESHPTCAELLAMLPGARRIEVVFRDLEDGSLAALSAYPERLVDARWHRQTSYFERLERDHPDEMRTGLARLRADIAGGRAPRRPGLASVLAWGKPPATSTAAG